MTERLDLLTKKLSLVIVSYIEVVLQKYQDKPTILYYERQWKLCLPALSKNLER